MRNGVITGQFKNGTIDKITLRTHTDADVRSIRKSDNKKGLPTCFAQNLTLLRLKPAWSIASLDGSENLWRCLSEKALEVRACVRVCACVRACVFACVSECATK